MPTFGSTAGRTRRRRRSTRGIAYCGLAEQPGLFLLGQHFRGLSPLASALFVHRASAYSSPILSSTNCIAGSGGFAHDVKAKRTDARPTAKERPLRRDVGSQSGRTGEQTTRTRILACRHLARPAPPYREPSLGIPPWHSSAPQCVPTHCANSTAVLGRLLAGQSRRWARPHGSRPPDLGGHTSHRRHG